MYLHSTILAHENRYKFAKQSKVQIQKRVTDLSKNVHNNDNTENKHSSCNKMVVNMKITELMMMIIVTIIITIIIIVTIKIMLMMIMIIIILAKTRVILMKIMIIVAMEVFVIKAIIVTVKKMSYRRNGMERKRKKLWLEQKTGQVNTQRDFFFVFNPLQAPNGNVKNYYWNKKKAIGRLSQATIPVMDK